MKNSKLRKVLLLACSAVLLVCLSVGATLAYLTSTDTVKNTFTVGKVAITLDEVIVDEYGVATTTNLRGDANTYKLLPGHKYTKDPTIHVAAGSEDCWLFVKIENGISGIEADKTIAAQMGEKGWTLVADTTNVYSYKDIQSAGADVVVFDNFTIKGDADVANYDGKTIAITAYAIQADGFKTAEAAWTAAELK